MANDTPIPSERKSAEDQLAELRQAVWDAYGVLGFDQDGDATPDHLAYPALPDFVRQFATEMRKDYDEACDEACVVMDEMLHKAEVYDRIAAIVREPWPKRPTRALRRIEAELIPEAD